MARNYPDLGTNQKYYPDLNSDENKNPPPLGTEVALTTGVYKRKLWSEIPHTKLRVRTEQQVLAVFPDLKKVWKNVWR